MSILNFQQNVPKSLKDIFDWQDADEDETDDSDDRDNDNEDTDGGDKVTNIDHLLVSDEDDEPNRNVG
jgi:hypothetical protein